MNYTIYKHIFPNGKVYVGITCRKPEDRWKNGLGYKKQYVYKAIEKYKWHNIEHKILYTGLSKKEAEKLEIELIKEYKSNDPKYGYNVDNGGNTSGTHSETTRKKLSEISKLRTGNKNPFYGKHHSKETMDKIKKATSIPIIQCDTNDNPIREWESFKAVERELHLDRKTIRLCCRGQLKQCGGYHWKYKEVA